MTQLFYSRFILFSFLTLFLQGCSPESPQKEPHQIKQAGASKAVASSGGIEKSLAEVETGSGQITGRLFLSGAVSVPDEIDTSADPVCSQAHSEPLLSESLVMNSGGALQNGFVYIKSGLEGRIFPVPRDAVVLDQRNCRYEPHVFGVRTGQSIQIRNSDATLHNVHAMPKKSREFNLGMPIKGMKLSKKFDTSEVMVKFKCDVHPWMSAYAGVLDHPFFAVTNESGSYEIKNVPPGRYKLAVWHERLGSKEQEITVVASQATVIDFTLSAT